MVNEDILEEDYNLREQALELEDKFIKSWNIRKLIENKVYLNSFFNFLFYIKIYMVVIPTNSNKNY